jgi:hypothetical protein
VWDKLYEKFFHNLAFDSIKALKGHLATALRTLEHQHENHTLAMDYPDSFKREINQYFKNKTPGKSEGRQAI